MAETIAQLLVKIGVEVKEATKGADKVKDSLKGIGKSAKGLGSVFGKSLGFLSAGFIAKKVFDQSRAFQKSLTDLGVASGISGKDLKKFGRESIRLSNKFGIASTDILHGLKTLQNLGIDAGESLEIIPSILKTVVATGADFETTTAAMETVLTDFNLTAADSEHIVDVFSEAMRRGNFDIQDWRNALKEAGSAAPLAGAKFEDVAASLEILGRAGIKGGEAGTALRNIFLGINSQLAKGAPLFEKYGIEVRKSDGTFKDFAGIIDAIKQRFKDLNPQQQTAFAQALVGKEAYSKLNQIIQKSPESFAGLAQEHENLSGVVEDASKKQLETVDGQLNRSKELINNFATDSEGTLSRWTANSIKFVNNAAEGWIIGFNAIGDVIDIATGKATADLRKFEAAARKAFDGVVQAATNGMNQVQSVVLNTTAKAQAWGLSLSRNLASGISKGNPGLESVARTTAGILAANLRHTTPKEGPLKDDNVWGAHFVSNLVKGIEMGMPSLNTVVGDLTSTLAVADVANNQPSSSVVNNNNSPTINVSARQANLDERGLGRMLERMRILNGGAF